jgi:tetratricopeptide (TPR) repeat protein
MKKLGRVGLVLGVLTLAGATGCEKEPDLVKQHRAKGTKHYNKKEYKEAAEEYGKSLALNPNQEEVWKVKAMAHMNAGEPDKAAQTTLKLLDLKKTPAEKAEVYRNAASVYMKSGPLEKAEEYFNEALKLEPKDEFSLGWIAEIYSQKGGARAMAAPAIPEHLDKALSYYDQVIAINPNSAGTYLNKRIVMAKFMEYERAMKEAADKEATENAKDKAKVADAEARAAQHLARFEEYKVKFDECTKKFSEATQAAKAAQAAEAPKQATETK